jgi:hypothetical protein
VTAEIENFSTRSPTVTWPFCSIKSEIFRRRCSANRRESLPLRITLIFQGSVYFDEPASSMAACLFIHLRQPLEERKWHTNDNKVWDAFIEACRAAFMGFFHQTESILASNPTVLLFPSLSFRNFSAPQSNGLPRRRAARR